MQLTLVQQTGCHSAYVELRATAASYLQDEPAADAAMQPSVEKSGRSKLCGVVAGDLLLNTDSEV